MSSWALTSWTWVESGAIFSGDMRSGKVPLVPKWFQTKHDLSLGTKVRCILGGGSCEHFGCQHLGLPCFFHSYTPGLKLMAVYLTVESFSSLPPQHLVASHGPHHKDGR